MNRGELRIYLGAAPGVGKTYAMLNEGWRRSQRGADVVVGCVETHGRSCTAEQLRDLEIVAPIGPLESGGPARTGDMDLRAVLRRRPQLCLVDDLAHVNTIGGGNAKRWQDVEELRNAGIDVITTVNVQHLDSLRDVVERITGVMETHTVPDAVVRSANQIELVDMSPEALRRRLAHGNVYPAERIDAAMADYFRPGNLGALRELALMWVADRVDETLQSYLEQHGIADVWDTRERIVVAVSGAPSSGSLVRRGARMAARTKGDLMCVHIEPAGRSGASVRTQAMESSQRLVTELGGSYHEVVADVAAPALVEFARSVHATRMIIGASGKRRIRDLLRGSFAQQIIAKAGDMEVHVIGSATDEPTTLRRSMPPRRRAVGRTRQRWAWAVTVFGLPVMTFLLTRAPNHIALPTVLLAFLVLVLLVAAIGGRRVSLVAAVAGALIENWFFVPPFHTLTIHDADNAVAIVMFLLVATTVGTLVEQAAQRSADAGRSRAEAEALARTSATLVSDPDPVPRLVEHVRSTFGFGSAAVLRHDGQTWTVVASSGEPVPTRPEDGSAFALDRGPDHGPERVGEPGRDRRHDPTGDHVLVLAGRPLTSEDRRVLGVFSAQLAVGLQSSRLASEAASAGILSEVDSTRTALLQAVSHDLRSPLAAIKTYVSGLRSVDVIWSPAQVQASLKAIDEETDRLNRLVGNLLDAGRLQAGTTAVNLRPTDIHEVVSSALTGQHGRIDISIDDALPLVVADPALLERSLANVVSNALRYQRPGTAVVVDAAEVGTAVHLRVVDRGPGIPVKERTRVLAPFQRLGDRNTTDGVGLGLAIASGFVRNMGGTFELDDTPGGGLTVTITVPSALDDRRDHPSPIGDRR